MRVQFVNTHPRQIIPTMLSSFFLVTLFAALAVRADPDPSEPGPGSVYNEGSTCHISWDPDTTGTWKTMNIELMCGDNYNMIHLTSVFLRVRSLFCV